MSERYRVTKRPTKPLPSVEYLRECFEYDLETGILTWKIRPREHFKTKRAWRVSNANWANKRAGLITPYGYRAIYVNGSTYLGSRIVTKWMTGEEPPKTVDHRDLDPANDRWENLRPATQQEQSWNQRLRKNTACGFRGVYRSHGYGRWCAAIADGGSIRRLGTYDTPEEAAAVYEAEARKLHGEFYREPEYAAKLASLTPKRRLNHRAPASGFRGVYRNHRAWIARLWKKGRQHYLGQFKTPEEAHEAYCRARDESRA